MHRREDGRVSSELRSSNCTLGLLENADGSASFSFDKTQVLVGVWGPAEPKLSKHAKDELNVSVSFSDATSRPSAEHMEYEKIIADTLSEMVEVNHFPRKLLSIVVQVLHDDGSVLAASINACCLALMDAGMSMLSMFSASSCTYHDESDELYLDVTNRECERDSCTTFVFNSDGEIISVLSEGSVEKKKFVEMSKLCENASFRLVKKFEEWVSVRISRALK
eukprot:TRINITY_DN3408_c0_g1_i1.p1 TRINITY_DN3408_c0_g1~~TRINITY_DN3408_c0_g1_i1.p1  ORF type:complete len:222 (+),score=52.10 TRINITY_DN3408_c0_g1_i1:61-726(+)